MRADFSLPTPRASGISPHGTAWSRYGAGTPLVLIHGVGMAQAVWAPQVNELASNFDVLVYDMWGHGDSTLPAGPLALRDYARQLVDLLNFLRQAATSVVGHSMGAMVALEFALSHAPRCQSVVAMNAVFCRTDEQRQAVQQRAEKLLNSGPKAYVDGAMQRWFGDPVAPEHHDAERLSRQLLSQVDSLGYTRAFKVFATADAQHALQLAALKAPCLFFTGERDPNSTPAMSQAMSRRAPLGQVKVLTGEGHMMNLTAPDQVNAILRNACMQA